MLFHRCSREVLAGRPSSTESPYAALVIFRSDFLKQYAKHEKAVVKVVLHEVAHAYMNHGGIVSTEVAKEHDMEADTLATKWYESSDYSKTN
jgi:predicted Zn-dependent protease with MMP-like domain